MNKIQKETIQNKFWNDLKNDLPRYSLNDLNDLHTYYRGYANGLYEADITSLEKHQEIIERLATIFVCERAKKSNSGVYRKKQV